jgi:hypothetical protein
MLMMMMMMALAPLALPWWRCPGGAALVALL